MKEELHVCVFGGGGLMCWDFMLTLKNTNLMNIVYQNDNFEIKS